MQFDVVKVDCGYIYLYSDFAVMYQSGGDFGNQPILNVKKAGISSGTTEASSDMSLIFKNVI